MIASLSIVGLEYDADAGRFTAYVKTEVRRERKDTQAVFISVLDGEGESHSEAIGAAIQRALSEPVLHKEKS